MTIQERLHEMERQASALKTDPDYLRGTRSERALCGAIAELVGQCAAEIDRLTARLTEVEKADEQRVRDICRLTEERDAARERVECAKVAEHLNG
ncbi:MAG: hypothetical protein GEU78_08000 [Actinobacteria bacterium]|nr:hypothetical protein [Actinomycetota bacterium]